MIDKSSDNKTEKTATKPVANFAEMGFGSIFVGNVIAGFLVGFVLDLWLNTSPIFLLIGIVVGIVSGKMKIRELLKNMELHESNRKESE